MVERTLRLLAAVLVVNGLLLSAWWLFPVGAPSPWFALEAAFVVGIFLLLPPGRWAFIAAGLASIPIVVLSLLTFSAAATRVILGRPFNLYLDLRLVGSVSDLLVGALGRVLAITVIALFGLTLLGTAGLLTYLLGPGGDRQGPPAGGSISGLHRRRWGAEKVLGAVLVAPLAVWLVGSYWPGVVLAPLPARVATPAVTLIDTQIGRLRETLVERERFEADLAATPAAYADVEGLFGALQGRDVILAFIESYGVSTLDDPRYSPVIRPRLEEFGRRMEEVGLFLASGTLVAPTQGGQSWFSHGSLLSGLWLDNQLRYDLMLRSGRETLIDDFRRAGYRTVALMPAITLAWPEGAQLGYDQIFARQDISYAGPPLNWVTMPDQFSWLFLERSIRRMGERGGGGGTGDRPMFVEVGLISSHAPWTPILPVLEDWNEIGDGRVFDSWAEAGERPEDLWLDTDRVREHFALSVDYAIHAMASYAERYVDENVLVIALGDHQPAPLITGDGASWEVPVHVISGDPELIEPFYRWGFSRGAIPSRTHPDRGMDLFRDWFVRSYSAPFESAIDTEDGREVEDE